MVRRVVWSYEAEADLNELAECVQINLPREGVCGIL